VQKAGPIAVHVDTARDCSRKIESRSRRRSQREEVELKIRRNLDQVLEQRRGVMTDPGARELQRGNVVGDSHEIILSQTMRIGVNLMFVVPGEVGAISSWR
jgi:hypothetical protein